MLFYNSMLKIILPLNLISSLCYFYIYPGIRLAFYCCLLLNLLFPLLLVRKNQVKQIFIMYYTKVI